MTTRVFRQEPLNFKCQVKVSGCFLEHEGKYLFLHRSKGMPCENTWLPPAGKFEKGETSEDAVIREFFEETSISLDSSHLHFIDKFYVKKPGLDYIYYLYYYKCHRKPEVTLNFEHQNYLWLSLDEALKLPLINGGAEIIHQFRLLSPRPRLSRKPFYFIRHGQTDANCNPNIENIDLDRSLNQEGERQAEKLREELSALSFKSICYSPLKRAKETKSILFSGIELDEHEIENLSECTGFLWKNMIALEEGHAYYTCDRLELFFKNLIRGIEEALEKEGPIAIVAHGGVHWALCYLLNIDSYSWKLENCEAAYFNPLGDSSWEAQKIAVQSLV